MRLVFPDLSHKEKAIAFIKEFYTYGGENPRINGTGGLDRYLKNSNYEEWLQKIHNDIDVANVPPHRVPALTYFYIREDGTIVGMVNIRLTLNDWLRREGGHIGYSIRPTERRKHYATAMVNDAMRVCDVLGIKEVMMVCDKDNVASAGTIKKCGGQLVEELYSETDKTDVQKYIIYR